MVRNQTFVGEETFDLVAEKQCAVDECVDPENDFNFKDFLALEESQLTPGASYKILIYGSSQGVKAPEQVTLSYIRGETLILRYPNIDISLYVLY